MPHMPHTPRLFLGPRGTRRATVLRGARRSPVRAACILVCLVATVGCGRCDAGHASLSTEARDDFGDIQASPPTDIDARAYLAEARAIVTGKGRGSAPPPPVSPGRRVALGWWRAGEAMVATATGPTLADAVAHAAESLAARAAGDVAGRLELDVVTVLEGARFDGPVDAPASTLGLEGFLVAGEDGKVGVVLPGEVVRRGGLLRDGKIDPVTLAHLLAERAGAADDAIGGMRGYRFRADVHVESVTSDAALSVVRAMAAPPTDVTPEVLLGAVRRGADYLARIVGPSGRYIYTYHPIDDRDDLAYGILRHAGTTYALFEAYGEFGDASYREKGELALAYLAKRLAPDEASDGRYAFDNKDEEQQKVGGAGLALVAFAEHAAVEGGRGAAGDVETMRSLARFILHAQYADGHFRGNRDIESETGKKLKRELWYYTGEAVLGLLRLYALDPQEAYLDGARRGADWVIRTRDAGVSADRLEHDHWMSYAFDDLYRRTGTAAYLDHALDIARAIEAAQRPRERAPAADYIGTFFEAQTAPGATRLEAYDSDIRLCRFAGRPDGWLVEPATQVARALLGQQFGPENDYWLKNPAKAEGGVRESPTVSDVRIDYVQHAMSAWLHLARALRDPAYGKTNAR
jgi:hypothetical protein